MTIQQDQVKVAAYYRSAYPDEGSLAIQRQKAEELLVCNPNYSLVRVYEDIGVSGLTPLELRPGGKSLLDDAHDRLFEKIIVAEPSRLSRSERELLRTYAFFFDLLGIEVVNAAKAEVAA